jgi:hypothetical protein
MSEDKRKEDNDAKKIKKGFDRLRKKIKETRRKAG